MTTHLTLSRLAGAAFLVTAISSAHAQTIYDNLSASQDGADAVHGFGPLANSFATGSSAVRLDGVRLLLDNLSSAYAGRLQVDLFSDPGTAPGAPIASLGSVSFANVSTAGAAAYTFTPATSVTLAADTRYCIEVGSVSANAVQWSWSNDLASTGVAGQSTWSQELGANANGASFGPYQMAVSVSAVPEPATAILLALGLGAVWTGRTLRLRSRPEA